MSAGSLWRHLKIAGLVGIEDVSSLSVGSIPNLQHIQPCCVIELFAAYAQVLRLRFDSNSRKRSTSGRTVGLFPL